MKKSLQTVDRPLVAQIREQLCNHYTNLHVYPEAKRIIVKGTFPIVSNGRVLDRYSVEIEIPPDYPRSWPIVREVGGRIPRTSDCHINPDGSACLFLPDEASIKLPKDLSFRNFLDGPVRNFFIGQSLVELNQPWPSGERPHGAAGILEFYRELLGTQDLAIVRKYLEYLGKKEIKGHWPCPCGSGRKLRKCHRAQVYALREKITPILPNKLWH